MNKKTKKLWLAWMLAAVLTLSGVSLPAKAHTASEINAADALYQLHLFLGTGDTYALDSALTRNQGVILLVRMMGKEAEAQGLRYTAPFADVAEAAKPHVSYAYANKLTNGLTATTFGGGQSLSDKQFCAFVLRALGYSDSGDAPDFQYANTRAMAKSLGLIDSEEPDSNFTRGDVVTIFWRALNLLMKDGKMTMAKKLMSQGVFTADEWEDAVRIQKNGISEGDPTGEKRAVAGAGEAAETAGGAGGGGGGGAGGGGSADGGNTSGEGGGSTDGGNTGGNTDSGNTDSGNTGGGNTGGGNTGGTGNPASGGEDFDLPPVKL